MKKQLLLVALSLLTIEQFSYARLSKRKIAKQISKLSQATFPPAQASYKILSKDNDFTMGPGIAMSQTNYNTAHNIINPNYMSALLQQEAQTKKDPYKWLEERKWYALTSLPKIECLSCKQKINFHNSNQLTEQTEKNLLEDITNNIKSTTKKTIEPAAHNSELTVTKCPYCQSSEIKLTPQTYKQFTRKEQQAMTAQLKDLGCFKQLEKSPHLPTCRLSINIADILQDNSDQIDEKKLQEQIKFIKSLHNPLLFIHHYANPTCKPHLFTQKSDIQWFVHMCERIIEQLPEITHVCPISQPVAFGIKSQKQLPPFYCPIKPQRYLQNIAYAHASAAKAIRKVAALQKDRKYPIKILLSHQWKPMKRRHSIFSWKYSIEQLAVSLAHRLYNVKFVSLFKHYRRHFDGLALSIYPALFFDLWKSQGDNSSGKLDADGALEAIYKMHKVFPKKEMYIVEAGCNTIDPARKIAFINMMLYICLQANQTIKQPIKTCFFWSLTNDIDFYREWNYPPGSTNFGFYDKLSIKKPTNSINRSGKHLKKILS